MLAELAVAAVRLVARDDVVAFFGVCVWVCVFVFVFVFVCVFVCFVCVCLFVIFGVVCQEVGVLECTLLPLNMRTATPTNEEQPRRHCSRTWLDRRHALADALDDAGRLVAEDAGEEAFVFCFLFLFLFDG